MKSSTTRRVGGLTAAAILVIFGIAAIVQGINGRSTVRSALTLEDVTGEPQMTPSAIAVNARKAGL